MSRRMVVVFFVVILVIVLSGYYQANNNEIVINPVKICEFAVGSASDKQIPNIDEGADLYTAPRNLVIDDSNNIYIFVVGENRIIKISPDGKDIKNYNLSALGDIVSITIDRSSNQIYALQDNQIIIFNTNMVMVQSIPYRKYFAGNNYFRKIKVFNGNIYI